MTLRLIPKRIRVAVLPRLRWLHRLGLRLDVLKVLLGHGHRVAVADDVKRYATIWPHLRDLCRDPATVAFRRFFSHLGYLAHNSGAAR